MVRPLSRHAMALQLLALYQAIGRGLPRLHSLVLCAQEMSALEINKSNAWKWSTNSLPKEINHKIDFLEFLTQLNLVAVQIGFG